jgi:hypothetical protein
VKQADHFVADKGYDSEKIRKSSTYPGLRILD